MISPPNTIDKTMKTVVGRAAIRIQIPKSVLRNRDGAVSAVVSGGKSRTDTPSPWTSTRRILHHYPLALVALEPITSVMDPDIPICPDCSGTPLKE